MSDLIIHRVKHDRNYKTINTTASNDKRLTWQARGLHNYLITKPDDWKTKLSAIVSAAPNGRDAVRTMLKELQKYGYLEITQERDKNGRFVTIWTVREVPEES